MEDRGQSCSHSLLPAVSAIKGPTENETSIIVKQSHADIFVSWWFYYVLTCPAPGTRKLLLEKYFCPSKSRLCECGRSYLNGKWPGLGSDCSNHDAYCILEALQRLLAIVAK